MKRYRTVDPIVKTIFDTGLDTGDTGRIGPIGPNWVRVHGAKVI